MNGSASAVLALAVPVALVKATPGGNADSRPDIVVVLADAQGGTGGGIPDWQTPVFCVKRADTLS